MSDARITISGRAIVVRSASAVNHARDEFPGHFSLLMKPDRGRRIPLDEFLVSRREVLLHEIIGQENNLFATVAEHEMALFGRLPSEKRRIGADSDGHP